MKKKNIISLFIICMASLCIVGGCSKKNNKTSNQVVKQGNENQMINETEESSEPADNKKESDTYRTTLFPLSKNASVDLDMDGKKDDIVYTADQEKEQSKLTINGIDFSDTIMQYYGMAPDTKYFGVCDLDSFDSYLELAIGYYGPSDDLVTDFFRYDGTKLLYIGAVPGMLKEYATKDGYEEGYRYSIDINGTGEISTNCFRLSIIQTWFASAKFKLTKDMTIDHIEQDVYHAVDVGWNFGEMELTKEMPVYKKPGDTNQKTFMLKPQIIKLTATDNKNWCKIEGADGTQGWFYVKDYDFIPSMNVHVSEIITNTMQYD